MNNELSVVVMGVSGSGKSTVGALLAEALCMRFIDADDLHSDANKKKMAAGIPLDDLDRKPWLDEIGRILAGGRIVVACSALRKSYRDGFRAIAPQTAFIALHGTRELLESRMSTRDHEYMPVTLLDSQLATFEPPGEAEGAIGFDVALPPEEIARRAIERLMIGFSGP
jgi:gluconokinase